MRQSNISSTSWPLFELFLIHRRSVPRISLISNDTPVQQTSHTVNYSALSQTKCTLYVLYLLYYILLNEIVIICILFTRSPPLQYFIGGPEFVFVIIYSYTMY